jgi:hypothetical protein
MIRCVHLALPLRVLRVRFRNNTKYRLNRCLRCVTNNLICSCVYVLIIHWQDPDAGDEYFDHLLTVTGVDSQFPDDAYHDTDVIHLEVHTVSMFLLPLARSCFIVFAHLQNTPVLAFLVMDPNLTHTPSFHAFLFLSVPFHLLPRLTDTQDHFNISAAIRRVPFASFALDRAEANSQTSGQFYSIRRDTAFAIALLGARDDDGSALPVRVDTTPTTEVCVRPLP